MQFLRSAFVILLPVVLLAAACGDTDGAGGESAPAAEANDTAPGSADAAPADTGPDDTAPEASNAAPAEPAPTTTSAPSGAPPDPRDRSSPITQQAIADLAERRGIEGADEVIVVIAEDVTWRNGSLGCPEPGMSYTQALVDGFRVILEVDGVRYAYHSGRGQAPFLCATPADNGTTTDA